MKDKFAFEAKMIGDIIYLYCSKRAPSKSMFAYKENTTWDFYASDWCAFECLRCDSCHTIRDGYFPDARVAKCKILNCLHAIRNIYAVNM